MNLDFLGQVAIVKLGFSEEKGSWGGGRQAEKRETEGENRFFKPFCSHGIYSRASQGLKQEESKKTAGLSRSTELDGPLKRTIIPFVAEDSARKERSHAAFVVIKA